MCVSRTSVAKEKEFIKRTVEKGMPFFGFCLGHQLLAEVLGGEVGPSERPEINCDGCAAHRHGHNRRVFG